MNWKKKNNNNNKKGRVQTNTRSIVFVVLSVRESVAKNKRKNSLWSVLNEALCQITSNRSTEEMNLVYSEFIEKSVHSFAKCIVCHVIWILHWYQSVSFWTQWYELFEERFCSSTCSFGYSDPVLWRRKTKQNHIYKEDDKKNCTGSLETRRSRGRSRIREEPGRKSRGGVSFGPKS